MYWYKTPFEKNAGWFFQERIAAKYVSLLNSQNKPAFVVSKAPLDFAYVQAFFSGNYEDPQAISAFNQNLKTKNYQIGQVKIFNDCQFLEKYPEASSSTLILEQGTDCPQLKQPALQISNPRDNGVEYKIYNDSVCSNTPLSAYPYPRKITEFSVEKMEQTQFCKTWITNP